MKKIFLQSIFCAFWLFLSSISAQAMDNIPIQNAYVNILSELRKIIDLDCPTDIIKEGIILPTEYVIEGNLAFLAEFFILQKVERIPDEVLFFLDESMLKFPNVGEHIILFSGRCVDILTTSNDPNRVAPTSDVFQRTRNLQLSDNEKIRHWANYYLNKIEASLSKPCGISARFDIQ